MTEAHLGAERDTVRPRVYDPADTWPEPDARLRNGGPRKAPPPPRDSFPMARWFSDVSASKGAPFDYLATQALAIAAGVVGGARAVQVRPNWIEPCVLWIPSIGNPSCGKSPSLAVLKRALQALERECAGDVKAERGEFEARKIEAEAARERWEASAKEAVKHSRAAPPMPEDAQEPQEPQPPRLVVGDITIEKLAELNAANPRGLVLIRDELAGLLGNFGRYSNGADEPVYLSAYNGDATPVDRKKGGTINAPRFCLSIVGGIQPDKFQALLEGRDNDGLVSRFLPVWPDPQPRVWEVPQADEGRFLEVLRRLRSLNMEPDAAGELGPRVLPLSAAASEAYAAWYKEQEAKIAASSGFMAEFLGKADGTCARVALVLELLQWAAGMNGPADGPAEVSALSVERACTLYADYFEPMARRVYADAALPPEERKAIALLREIEARALRTFNKREARRDWGVAGVSSAADMDAALAILEDGDCVRLLPDEKPGPGRKQKIYAVNPRLLKQRVRA